MWRDSQFSRKYGMKSRHWKQRFDVNESFVFRKRVKSKYGVHNPGDPVFNEVFTPRELKSFWASGLIELSDWEPPSVHNPHQVFDSYEDTEENAEDEEDDEESEADDNDDDDEPESDDNDDDEPEPEPEPEPTSKPSQDAFAALRENKRTTDTPTKKVKS